MKYLLSILVLLPVLYSVIKDNKRNNGRGLTRVGIILLILAVGGTLLSDWIEYDSSKESSVKEDSLNTRIAALTKKNGELRMDIKNLNDTLSKRGDILKSEVKSVKDSLTLIADSLIADNYKLSRALTSSSIEINRNIIGQGYGIFHLMGRPQRNSYYGFVQSVSRYPIYDVSFLVSNFDKVMKCSIDTADGRFIIDHDCYFINTNDYKTNYIYPMGINYLNYEINTTERHIAIETKMVSRGANTVQQSIIDLRQGTCPQSYRLYRYMPSGKYVLVESRNDLRVPDTEWSKRFFPLKNRAIGFRQTN